MKRLAVPDLALVAPGFPRLYAAASLKPVPGAPGAAVVIGFPRLYAAASLKPWTSGLVAIDDLGFPRLYAAASLKLHYNFGSKSRLVAGFPRLYAAASLKLSVWSIARACAHVVFRGFMPRPH